MFNQPEIYFSIGLSSFYEIGFNGCHPNLLLLGSITWVVCLFGFPGDFLGVINEAGDAYSIRIT